MMSCLGIYTNSPQTCTYLQDMPRTFPCICLKVCENRHFACTVRSVFQTAIDERSSFVAAGLFVNFMT